MNLTTELYINRTREKVPYMLSNRIKIFRWIEIIGLYFGIPLLLKFDVVPILKLVPLFLMFVIYLYILLRDKDFKKKRFKLNGFRAWRMILYRSAVMVIFLVFFTWFFYRDQYLALPTQEPLLWLRIVLIYPFFSVIPQELVYRVYFYHRFQGLFANRNLLILLNSVLFSFMHILYENWVAIVFTFVASILFSLTYLRHRSFTIVALEHSIYGLLIFTIGPGSFFHT
jgi:membrane protease YdiL (CAAX protease family)